MSNPWTKLVQEKFRLGRMTNPSYSLGQAMKSAKKVYKTGVSVSSDVSKSLGLRKSQSKRRKSSSKRSKSGGRTRRR